jgi:hypothetical protein
LEPRSATVFQRYANVATGKFFLTQNSVEKIKKGINIMFGEMTNPLANVNITSKISTNSPNIFTGARNWLEESPFNPSSWGPGAPAGNPDIDDSVESIVKRVDDALTRAGEQNGIGCRNNLCEASAGYIKADAEINGVKAENYNIRQVQSQRGISPEDSLFGDKTHEITIITNKNGDRYLVDLTIGQFSTIDLESPIAKQLLNNGFIKLNEANLNEYLNLFKKGNYPPVSLDILNNLNSHSIFLSPDEVHKYLNGDVISLKEEPIVFSTGNTMDDILNASEILVNKGYTYDEIDNILFDSQDPLKIANEAPTLKLTLAEGQNEIPMTSQISNWVEEKIINPIKNLFGGGGSSGTNFGDDALLTIGSGTYKYWVDKNSYKSAKDASLQDA